MRADIGCVLLLLLTVVHDGEGVTGKQNVLLQHAVKTLLGFREVPQTGVRTPRSALPQPGSAPSYMLELYEQFKYGQISKGRKAANTVRSINAQIGK